MSGTPIPKRVCMLRSLAHAIFSLRVCCSLFPQPVVWFYSALLSLRGHGEPVTANFCRREHPVIHKCSG